MSRIQKAYEVQFRALLREAHARRLEEGVQWLSRKAQQLSKSRNLPLARALTCVYSDLRRKVPSTKPPPSEGKLRFFCDAGLGGLARMLRAAGYEADWEAGIDDAELLRKAARLPAVVLTTDSLMMERGTIQRGEIRAFWLPPTLKVREQLGVVFSEFGLIACGTRCMDCGGELLRGDKEALRERIPPKTYRWLDDYFVCGRCGKLYWRGTHWANIAEGLRSVS